MALIGSSSSFVLARSGKISQCSECLKEIPRAQLRSRFLSAWSCRQAGVFGWVPRDV